VKLFIPGPTYVRPEILQEMARQMIGHRDPEFAELLAPIIAKLKQILYTRQEVFVATCSATGLWEMGIRNLCRRKVLCATCGAFSERWAKVAEANGKEVTCLSVEWGKPNLPETIADALRRGDYDAFLLVHSETSTGLANPLAEIAEVLRDHPDVMFLVDAVSSMGGMKIEFDQLGIDFLLASVQKCFALPPGLAICAVSERALERAKEVPNRGYYFDLLEYKKNQDKFQTISTPCIPQLYALAKQLDAMLAEGMEARFRRHRQMAEYVREWARRRFALFPEAGYESDTLTTVTNTRKIDIRALNRELKAKHDCMISNGYGKLKDITFRIAHMGDLQMRDMEELLGWIDTIIG